MQTKNIEFCFILTKFPSSKCETPAFKGTQPRVGLNNRGLVIDTHNINYNLKRNTLFTGPRDCHQVKAVVAFFRTTVFILKPNNIR